MIIISAFGYEDRKTKLVDSCNSIKDLANFTRISYSSLMWAFDIKKNDMVWRDKNGLYINDSAALRILAKMEL